MKNKFFVGLLGLLSFSLVGCGPSIGIYADGDKYLAGNQVYDQNIEVLDIDWISGDLTLVEDLTIEGVKIEEQTNYTNSDALVHSYLNNGELKIKYFASGYRAPWQAKTEKNLTVTYKPGLTKINVELTSGSLEAKTLTSKEVKIDMTSGSANVNAIVSETTNVEYTSGSVNLESVATKTFDADGTSGDIKVAFVSLETGKFESTSGDIDLTLPVTGGTVKVSQTSGHVTTNRECSINNDTYTFGSGSASINVKMTSGNLVIR